MDRLPPGLASMFSLVFSALCLAGCYSPYHADRGALAGGLVGAGTGAIVGNALGGNAGPGAAIGAGLGAMTGGLIGHDMDETEARNRYMIEQQLGQQLAAGAVTINDVVAMAKAGVNDDLIINHIRAHGVAAPLQSGDLIYLQQQGVSARVVSAMQAPPPVVAPQPVVVEQPAVAPVIVQEYRYGPRPRWYAPPRYYPAPYGPPRPRVGWGVAIHN
jgi:hypothetical protein